MKKIIITGTSRGIGYELVSLFAKANFQVLALSRNVKPVEELNLKNVTTIACDVTKRKDLTEVESWVSKEFGNVDILINNAGAIVNKAFKKTSTEDFEKVYKTNVFGVAAITKILLPFMGNHSHVVNISSMGGIQGSMKFPGLAAYSSSKAAVIALTELLAEEYKENGPSFNVLALGAVQTEMLQEAFPGYTAPVSAADMAAYVFDFAQNGNKYYNGKVLQVSNSTP